MKNKSFLLVIVLIIIALVIPVIFLRIANANKQFLSGESIETKPVSSEISAGGSIHSQSEATLHFQTGGKLVYLPFKEGDSVYQGQTVASLDTSGISATFRQAQQDFTAAKAVVEKVYAQTGRKTDESFDEKITRTAAEAAQNKAYDNMVKAQTDLNNVNLTSPITGVLVHEDVTTSSQNVTPSTSFVIADPNQLVFRANVLASDIDFISVGSPASIRIDGMQEQVFSGTVVWIYPQKITLPNGEYVYPIDVQSSDLQTTAKLGQAGTVLIKTNVKTDAVLVPSWTVLNNHFIWVNNNGKPELRKVIVGKMHGLEIEISNGLSASDKVIIDPQSILEKEYPFL